MLRILRAELAYGAGYLIVLAGIALALWGYEVTVGQGIGGLIDPAGEDLVFGRPAGDLPLAEFLVVVFVVVSLNGLFTARAREQRERLLAVLPVTRRQLGAVRLSLLLVPGLVTFVFYGIPNWIYPPTGGFEPTFLAMSLGSLLVLYSAFFIVNDRPWGLTPYTTAGPLLFVLRWPRNLRSTGVAGIVRLTALIVAGLGVLPLVAWKPSGSGAVQAILEFVRTYNPFGGAHGPLIFLFVGLVLGGLTVLSYGKRRSLVEPCGPSALTLD